MQTTRAAMEPILIVTRPAPAGAAFAAAVMAVFGAPLSVIHAPALRIVPLPFDWPGADHVILTSAQGAQQAPSGDGLTAWCVGDATASAAAEKGYAVRSAAGDADALVALIMAARPAGRLVHLAGRHRRGDIAARLTAAGLPCTTIACYDQIAEPVPDALIQAARGTAPLVVPVFSPRSAAGILSLPGHAPLHVIAISAAVAAAFRQISPRKLLTVGHPDADHMRDMTVAVLRSLSDAVTDP